MREPSEPLGDVINLETVGRIELLREVLQTCDVPRQIHCHLFRFSFEISLRASISCFCISLFFNDNIEITELAR